MVGEEVIDSTLLDVVNGTGIFGEAVIEVGRIANWIQAIGFLVVIWFVIQIIFLILNRKKKKALYKIREDLERIEKKLDRVLKKKK